MHSAAVQCLAESLRFPRLAVSRELIDRLDDAPRFLGPLRAHAELGRNLDGRLMVLASSRPVTSLDIAGSVRQTPRRRPVCSRTLARCAC